MDFKNTVIIMTSNVGSGASAETIREMLRSHFKPEFLNRIDDIIFFHALRREDIRAIIDIQLDQLLKRLADRKLRLVLSDAARDLIVEEGYDPVYGARPLKRTLQRRLLDPLALAVLQGTFTEGDTVRVDAESGRLVLNREQGAGRISSPA